MAARPLSPVARTHLHDGSLVWGVVLLVVALLASSTWASAPAAHHTAVGVTVALLLAAAGLLAVGVRGRLAAADVNRRDNALADALTDQLGLLCQHGRPTAYALGPDAAEVAGARIVEAERHFDQQTTGIVDGAMNQQLRYFGHSLGASYGGVGTGILAGSVGGLSTIALGVTSTTRTNLMADSVHLGPDAPLLVMPLGFPELFGRAVGLAADQADRALTTGSSARARSLR